MAGKAGLDVAVCVDLRDDEVALVSVLDDLDRSPSLLRLLLCEEFEFVED